MRDEIIGLKKLRRGWPAFPKRPPKRCENCGKERYNFCRCALPVEQRRRMEWVAPRLARRRV